MLFEGPDLLSNIIPLILLKMILILFYDYYLSFSNFYAFDLCS